MVYTIRVQWIVLGKHGYLPRNKWYRNIQANSILEASKIALDNHKTCICPSVSCAWPNWPQ